MFKWLNNWLGSSVTATSSSVPTGDAFAALAIKSSTTNFAFTDTRPALELVRGTVAACLSARASERSVLQFECSNADAQHVLDNPNPVQSQTDFMEMASLFYDATGQAVIFFVSVDGIPKEAWILPSFFVTPIFSDPADPVPAGYRWSDGRVITETDNLCIIRNNSLKTAPYTGTGFLVDHYDSAYIYDLVVRSQKNYFWNGGAPNVALVAKEGVNLTTDQIKTIQDMWNSKYNPATGTTNAAVLPHGMQVQDFGPKELNFNLSKDELRDSIREALQVPKIILGDTDNVNHNNGQTALAMFERLVVLRFGQKMASGLQAHFRRTVDSKITVRIDENIIRGFTTLPAQGSDIKTPEVAEFDKLTKAETV